ncbi:MAG: hypothetical protein AAF570_17890, partial [Bacteroidota bacterium]
MEKTISKTPKPLNKQAQSRKASNERNAAKQKSDYHVIEDNIMIRAGWMGTFDTLKDAQEITKKLNDALPYG